MKSGILPHMETLHAQLAQAIKDLYPTVALQVELSRTDEQFGDYATNVALQLAGRLGRTPRDIASELADKLSVVAGDTVKEISIAGPGFINIRLSDEQLIRSLSAPTQKPQIYHDQTIVTEYSDPNPFKVLHVGHLYTTLVGDVVSRILAATGGQVHRVNFGGDVGLHVAKSMWGILQELGGEFPDKLEAAAGSDLHSRSKWLSSCYIKGNTAYEEDEAAKAEIVAINKRVYAVHTQDDHKSPFAQIYWLGRAWSYDYFKQFYDDLEVTQFEKYYPESATTPTGLETVQEQLKNGVYQQSDGAVVFDGEKFGLHTRVFINSQGLPTYEAKDVGLIMQKWRDYSFDLSVVITGNDITEYMKVVQKSIEQFMPELTKRSRHLPHGNIKMAGGVKMSSRKGNGLLAVDVLDAAMDAAREAGRDNRQTMLGAVKYALLRSRIGGDIIYDPEESVSLEGNSGPYLQYAHARARSILAKAAGDASVLPDSLEEGERSLVRKISEYPDVIERAAKEYLPHYLCTYLYELAQAFNRFYEQNRVIGDERQAVRLCLVNAYAAVLRDGLELLGIEAPDRL